MSTLAVSSPAQDAAVAGAAPRHAVIRSAQDVARIVNAGAAHGSNARIVIAIALGGVFLDAYDLTSLAYGVKDIARQFALTPVQVGFVASAITFGAILGALFGGYLTDRIGRYRVFMADMLFFVVAAIAAGLLGHAGAASKAIMRAYWGEGRDISQPEVLTAALDAAGLPGAEILAKTQDPAVKDQLRANTEEAMKRGVFGAPTMFVGKAMFWGNDRLEHLRMHLQGKFA